MGHTVVRWYSCGVQILGPDELAAAADAVLRSGGWCVLERCAEPASRRWEPRLLIFDERPTRVAAAVADELVLEPSADARLAGYDRATLRRLAPGIRRVCHLAPLAPVGGAASWPGL